MEISGGQGANSAHLFGLAPQLFLDWGHRGPHLSSQKALKSGFSVKYNKHFARATGVRTDHILKFYRKASNNCKIRNFFLESAIKISNLAPNF